MGISSGSDVEQLIYSTALFTVIQYSPPKFCGDNPFLSFMTMGVTQAERAGVWILLSTDRSAVCLTGSYKL